MVSCSDESSFEFGEGQAFHVLEDNIHTTRQSSRTTHSFARTSYDDSHGYSKAFELLRANNVGVQSVSSGKITPETLKNVDVFFVNLLDEKEPRFEADEVTAVESFVRSGGGLMVIVDHTNAYRHSELSQVLLEPYGFELPYELACDVPAGTTFKPPHWLNITRIDSHPVTQGVRNFGVFAGGPIEGPGSLGRTSDLGFRESWNPDEPPSYWGNFEKDEDEPTKSSSVLNAIEYGDGRVVVVGDQNMFGNSVLGWADDRRLWLNAMQWLAGADEQPLLADQPLPKPELLVDYRGNDLTRFASSGHWGYLAEIGRQDDFYTSLALADPTRA